jgi:hypothetical protein
MYKHNSYILIQFSIFITILILRLKNSKNHTHHINKKGKKTYYPNKKIKKKDGEKLLF